MKTRNAIGHRPSAILLGIVLTLTSAAVLPAQQQAQLDVTPASVPASFWVTLGDTTLQRLMDQALAANRDVQVAQARVRSARAARTAAALELTPSVTAVGGYARQRYSNVTVPGATGVLPDQQAWDAGLQMSWDVDVFGRSRRALQGQR
ncbi:MAG: TolC family protein, partial [bacterium]